MKGKHENVWCTLFPKLKNSLLFLLFLKFLITDSFFRKTNLTSHHEILTKERQINELPFKGYLVAKRKLKPELWTLILTSPRIEKLYGTKSTQLNFQRALIWSLWTHFEKRMCRVQTKSLKLSYTIDNCLISLDWMWQEKTWDFWLFWTTISQWKGLLISHLLVYWFTHEEQKF